MYPMFYFYFSLFLQINKFMICDGIWAWLCLHDYIDILQKYYVHIWNVNREIDYRLVPLKALCINSIINIRCTWCCIFKLSWSMVLLSYSYFIAAPHWIASLMRHIGTINQYSCFLSRTFINVARLQPRSYQKFSK